MNGLKQLIRLLLPLCLAVFWSGAAWALSQTQSPSACSSVGGIGTVDWSNAGRAVANDGSYATASLNDWEVTRFLKCTGFNFSIPGNATINGITVSVNRSASNNNSFQDAAMRIVKGDAIGSTDRSTSTAYTTTDTVEAHGSATDLWGTTWTPADINAANFGTAFAAQKATSAGKARTVYVDHIEITVDYSLPVACTPPPNAPAGVPLACVCDNFGRSNLNPSTIFGANWITSTSDTTGILPSIVNPGYLRLTDNTGNNAKAVTVPGVFPAAGNYISVEFQQFAYNGTGADGIAIILSDYSTSPVPGAFGGSLGYAPKTPPAVPSNIPGFAGGWIGVALDEYGNYQNPTEGRTGGPGQTPQSVAVRGSGSGVSGYGWLGGTGSLTPLIDDRSSTTPSRGYYYQVVVDARTPANTAIAVNRDTGSGYSPLISIPNVYSAAAARGLTQAAVPANWQISFTGSTGGSTNIHEISGLRICAQTVAPPSGGTATGFGAIDEGYGAPSLAVQNYLTGHIYTKLVGMPFKLNVAALNNGQIQTAYAADGNIPVTVKLVDNSDGACILDSTQANYCSSACTGKSAVAGGSQTLTFTSANRGELQSANFTLNSAYRNLVAVISDGTVNACSTDAFSVRPQGIVSVTSNATNAAVSGTPTFKAGSGAFTLTATTGGIAGNASGYTGILKINNAVVRAAGSSTVAGTLTPASFPVAVPGTGSSTATGSSFTYSEVGAFMLPGFDPSVDQTSPRAVFDGVATSTECAGSTAAQCDLLRSATWTAVDSISSKGDCVADSYANSKDAGGKYGCNFGNVGNTAVLGRFIPDHFEVSGASIVNRSDIAGGAGCTPASSFTYMGEPLRVSFTLSAMNAAGAVTRNYADGSYARLSATNWLGYGSQDSIGLWMTATGYAVGGGTCRVVFSNTTPSATDYLCTGGANPASISRAAGPRVRVWGTPPTPNWVNGASAFTADALLERADKGDGAYATLNVGVAPTDADGVTLGSFDLDADTAAGNERKSLGSTNARYGKLLIPNAYGSELLSLPLNLQAQYWNGTSYTANTDDNCTALPASNFSIAQGRGASISTSIVGGGTMAGGKGTITLSKPNNSLTATGSVIVKASPTMPVILPIGNYLPGQGVDTFGVYKSGPVIYVRELYP